MRFPSVSEWLMQTRWVEGRKWAEPGWSQERMSGRECKTAVDGVLLNEPLLVHPTGDLWGTGDKGPTKEHVLPFWTKFWTKVLSELSSEPKCFLDWATLRPGTEISGAALMSPSPDRDLGGSPCSPLWRIFWHRSVCFPSSQQQLQFRAPLNHRVMFKAPLGAFAWAWHLLRPLPCVIPLKQPHELLFCLAGFCQHTAIIILFCN